MTIDKSHYTDKYKYCYRIYDIYGRVVCEGWNKDTMYKVFDAIQEYKTFKEIPFNIRQKIAFAGLMK